MKLLSRIYFGIQKTLIPALNEEIGPLTDTQKRFVAVCEIVRPEAHLRAHGWCGIGRKPKSRLAIARAFLAKALWNLPTTRALIDRLKSDTALRRLCGWDNGPSDVPDEATFSRACATFAQMGLGDAIHKALVSDHLGSAIILHSAIDGTAIEAREKAHRTTPIAIEPLPLLAETLLAQIINPSPTHAPKPEARPPANAAAVPHQTEAIDKPKPKRGRPRKGQAPAAPEPTRLERHLASDLVANLLDMPEVICTHGVKKNAKGHTDHWVGYKLHLATGDGGVPLAAYLSSASLHDSQAAIILQQSVAQRTRAVLYDLADSAYDATAIKAHSRTLGSEPIIDANKRSSAEPPAPMEPDRAKHYQARSAAERSNSQLKDNHGGRNVRVRGGSKVMAHLMFGIIVMSAEALIRLV